jgi:hypothetical protein
MRRCEFSSFGLDQLELTERETPAPKPGELRLDVEAFSLNYRDLLVVKDLYNPNISIPAVPVSNAAGTVATVGEGVTRVAKGDRVMTHFVSNWIDGPFEKRYVASTLGVPRAELAAEKVILPERAQRGRDLDLARRRSDGVERSRDGGGARARPMGSHARDRRGIHLRASARESEGSSGRDHLEQ